jgi:hypothetical protein
MIEEFELNITDSLLTKCLKIADDIKNSKLNSIYGFNEKKFIVNSTDYELYKGHL